MNRISVTAGNIGIDFGRHGPDRARHRNQISIHEDRRVPPRVEKLAQRHALRSRIGEDLRRFAIEAQNLPQQRVMRARKIIASLREKATQAAARIFKGSVVPRYRERHVTGLRLNAQFSHQPAEVWIGSIVMNDKTGVYRDRSLVGLHHHRVGVATQAIVALEHVYFVPAAKIIGCR